MAIFSGNFWSFPFIWSSHGGFLFVIIYAFLLIVIGRPLYFLELAVGQLTGKGAIKSWDLVPAARG